MPTLSVNAQDVIISNSIINNNSKTNNSSSDNSNNSNSSDSGNNTDDIDSIRTPSHASPDNNNMNKNNNGSKHGHHRNSSSFTDMGRRFRDVIELATSHNDIQLIRIVSKSTVLISVHVVSSFVFVMILGNFSANAALCLDGWINSLCALYFFQFYHKSYKRYCCLCHWIAFRICACVLFWKVTNIDNINNIDNIDYNNDDNDNENGKKSMHNERNKKNNNGVDKVVSNNDKPELKKDWLKSPTNIKTPKFTKKISQTSTPGLELAFGFSPDLVHKMSHDQIKNDKTPDRDDIDADDPDIDVDIESFEITYDA